MLQISSKIGNVLLKRHQVRRCSRKTAFDRNHQGMCGKLPDECYKFEFHLAEKCHSAENCNITSESYNESCPKSRETFLNIWFPPHWTKSVKIQLKLDTIFHIIYYVMYNGKKHNPFHVGLPKLFHNHSRAKLVTQLLNKVSFCISYNELERINLVLWNK